MVGLPLLAPAIGYSAWHRRGGDAVSRYSLALAEKTCRHRQDTPGYEQAVMYYQWKYSKQLQNNAFLRAAKFYEEGVQMYAVVWEVLFVMQFLSRLCNSQQSGS